MKDFGYGGERCILYWCTIFVRREMARSVGHMYLRRVKNTCITFRTPYSRAEITNVQLAQLHQELKQYVDRDLDSVIIFKSRQERWLDKEFWGKEDDMTSFLL